MTGHLVNEVGYFWQEGLPIPTGNFAPDLAVPGVLTISDRGEAFLELHSMFTWPDGMRAASVDEDGWPTFTIVGVLKATGDFVRISKLREGGSSYRNQGHGISHEKYYGLTTLVSPSSESVADEFTELRIDLANMKDWVNFQQTDVDFNDRSTTLQLDLPDDIVCKTHDGTLGVEFSYTGSLKDRVGTIEETIHLVFRPAAGKSLDEMISIFWSLENLLLLFIGKEIHLPFPSLKNNRNTLSRYYFSRIRPEMKTIRWTDCFLLFKNIGDRLGAIFDQYRMKFAEHKPGFFLFLSTKRGQPLYSEHLFVSLVWGLESLHRLSKQDNEPNPIAQKVERILAAVAPRDRRWLEARLRHASEPNLATRIFELISSTPLPIDKRALHAFASECATLRNEISHFGGTSRTAKSTASSSLQQLTPLLSTLYHIHLLQKIGIPDNALVNIFSLGPLAHNHKASLEMAGVALVSAGVQSAEN